MADFNIKNISIGEYVLAQTNGTPAPAGIMGKIHTGWVNIGPGSGDELARVNGFNFSTDDPQVVLTQARQMSSADVGFEDQFAIQVIETRKNNIVIRIRRIDLPSHSWGQDIRIDFLIIE
jgi:hypothetical protein